MTTQTTRIHNPKNRYVVSTSVFQDPYRGNVQPRGNGKWFFDVEMDVDDARGCVRFETVAYGTYTEAREQVLQAALKYREEHEQGAYIFIFPTRVLRLGARVTPYADGGPVLRPVTLAEIAAR